jgi:hypothetical protein
VIYATFVIFGVIAFAWLAFIAYVGPEGSKQRRVSASLMVRFAEMMVAAVSKVTREIVKWGASVAKSTHAMIALRDQLAESENDL